MQFLDIYYNNLQIKVILLTVTTTFLLLGTSCNSSRPDQLGMSPEDAVRYVASDEAHPEQEFTVIDKQTGPDELVIILYKIERSDGTFFGAGVAKPVSGQWISIGNGGLSKRPPSDEVLVDYSGIPVAIGRQGYFLIFGRALSENAKSVEIILKSGAAFRSMIKHGMFAILVPSDGTPVRFCTHRVFDSAGGQLPSPYTEHCTPDTK